LILLVICHPYYLPLRGKPVWIPTTTIKTKVKTLLRRGAVALPREFGAGLRVAGWRAAAALWRGSRAGLRLSGCRGLAGLG
jgi:hypothetical protein